MFTEPTIYYLSEQAITMQFADEISEEVWVLINSFNTLLHSNPFKGFSTSVPGYTTLSVFYNPVQVLQNSEMPGEDSFEKVAAYLKNLKNIQQHTTGMNGQKIEIPVCYGGEHGPDIEEVARLHQISTEEVIQLHSSAVYKVYMMGFVPGFAYLGGMNASLSTPRKQTPAKSIPAGSVGIAGGQTGIYPLQTPGGWQIIGRTPLTLFNPEWVQPSLLQAGDRVIFTPVSKQEFEEYLHRINAD